MPAPAERAQGLSGLVATDAQKCVLVYCAPIRRTITPNALDIAQPTQAGGLPHLASTLPHLHHAVLVCAHFGLSMSRSNADHLLVETMTNSYRMMDLGVRELSHLQPEASHSVVVEQSQAESAFSHGSSPPWRALASTLQLLTEPAK